jgi:hypothetical protein
MLNKTKSGEANGPDEEVTGVGRKEGADAAADRLPATAPAEG